MLGRRVLILAVAGSVLGVAAPARAQPPTPPPDVPSIAQYVESVPTADGGRATGRGGGRQALSPAVEAKLRTLDPTEARALERLATETNLGAPQNRLPGVVGADGSGSAVAAGAGALSDDESGDAVRLLVVLALVFGAAMTAASRRFIRIRRTL